MLRQCCNKTVLLNEVINNLNIIADGVYVDGTFGSGGHSKVILSNLGKSGRLFSVDRDFSSISIGEIIAKRDKRLTMIHGRFSKLFKYMKYYNLIGKVNGIFLDLGMSRSQVEDAERGFSFLRDGPLDMRMDINSCLSASDWLRKASLEKIIWVLQKFGEEKYARRIARSIISYRKCGGGLTRTHELVRLIIRSIPFRDQWKHPATRTFQAIRIYINNELDEIRRVLSASLLVLAPRGRLVVITFHSLEDRIVKCFIRKNGFPISVLNEENVQFTKKFKHSNNLSYRKIQKYSSYTQNQKNVYLKLISRVFPSQEEIKNNICSRSAILRCSEKTVI